MGKILGIYHVTADGIDTHVEIVGEEKVSNTVNSLYQPSGADTWNGDIRSLEVNFSAMNKISKGETVTAQTSTGKKVKIKRVADLGTPGYFDKGVIEVRGSNSLNKSDSEIIAEIETKIKDSCSASNYSSLCQRIQTPAGLAYAVNRCISMMAKDKIHFSAALAQLEAEEEGID
jgi:hypothetical protein